MDNGERKFQGAVTALCICSLANAFVVINLYPYSGYMVMHLLPDTTTPETVGRAAGILAASFMGGRFITAYWWGKIADTFGRVIVLETSLILSVIFSLLFGTATTYRMAIFWRLCHGMSNAITSTQKTLASEIGNGDDQKEKQAMGLVVGMWSWGFLIGPAIGGIFADPIKQYPSSFHQSRWLKQLFQTYPFLLPNIIVAAFCLLGAILVPFYIDETLDNTHPPRSCLFWKQQSNESQPLILKKKDLESASSSVQESLPPIWSRQSTRRHMTFNWIFSFVVPVVDEGFPLFCISTVGGLGFDEASIGQVLSLAGILFVIGQYVIYTFMIQKLGVYRTIMTSCFLGLVPLSSIPLSVWLIRTAKSKLILFTFLSVVIGFTKIMICNCFSSLAIATNKSVPKEQRAKMNGINLLGSSISKGLGPIFAGFLVPLSFSGHLPFLSPETGSVFIFGVVGIMGLITTFVAVQLKNEYESIDFTTTNTVRQ